MDIKQERKTRNLREKQKTWLNSFDFQVVIIGDDGDGGEYGHLQYLLQGSGKKGKKRRKNKKNKTWKRVTPMLYGAGGLKLLLYHFFIKKMALLSILAFFFSKLSFLTSTLIALKLFFNHQMHHERSAESNKLEVVHVPIKKQNTHGSLFPEYERYQADESKLDINTYVVPPPKNQKITTTARPSYSDLFYRTDATSNNSNRNNRFNQFKPYNNQFNSPNNKFYDYRFI